MGELAFVDQGDTGAGSEANCEVLAIRFKGIKLPAAMHGCVLLLHRWGEFSHDRHREARWRFATRRL